MSASKSSEAYYNKGILYYEQGQYDPAIECFAKAIEKNGSNAQFHYNLGLAYVKKQEYVSAINSFKKAISINPKDADVFHNLGLAYLKKGTYSKAIQAYNNVLELKPDDPDSYYNLGIAFFLAKNYADSISHFKKSLVFNPNNPSVLYNLAYVYYIDKQYDLAKENFLNVISINNDDIEAHFNLGNTYLKQNEQDLALESFNKVMALKPDHKGAKTALIEINKVKDLSSIELEIENYLQKAFKLLGNKELELAIEEFKKILILKNDHPRALQLIDKTTKLLNEADVMVDKGLTYFSNNNYFKAIECLKKALSIKPKDPRIKSLLDNATEKYAAVKEKEKEVYKKFIEDGQYDLAVDKLKKAVSENPKDVEANLDLGKVYIKQKEFYSSLDSLRKTLSIDPSHKEVQDTLYDVVKVINTYEDESKDYFMLALIYVEKKDYINALKALKKVLELKPEDPKTKVLLTKVMTLINKANTSYDNTSIDQNMIDEISKYRKQIKENPQDHVAYYKLGVICVKMQKYDIAMGNLKKALEIKPDYKEAQQSLFDLMRIINS